MNLLNATLDAISHEEKEAYLLALLQCPDQVFGGWRGEVVVEMQQQEGAGGRGGCQGECWDGFVLCFADESIYFIVPNPLPLFCIYGTYTYVLSGHGKKDGGLLLAAKTRSLRRGLGLQAHDSRGGDGGRVGDND